VPAGPAAPGPLRLRRRVARPFRGPRARAPARHAPIRRGRRREDRARRRSAAGGLAPPPLARVDPAVSLPDRVLPADLSLRLARPGGPRSACIAGEPSGLETCAPFGGRLRSRARLPRPPPP